MWSPRAHDACNCTLDAMSVLLSHYESCCNSTAITPRQSYRRSLPRRSYPLRTAALPAASLRAAHCASAHCASAQPSSVQLSWAPQLQPSWASRPASVSEKLVVQPTFRLAHPPSCRPQSSRCQRDRSATASAGWVRPTRAWRLELTCAAIVCVCALMVDTIQQLCVPKYRLASCLLPLLWLLLRPVLRAALESSVYCDLCVRIRK